MGATEPLLIFRILSFIVIRCRSLGLMIFNLFMDFSVRRLTALSDFVKFIGRYAQAFFGIITGHHYSLVNVSDDDFSIGITTYHLFKQTNKTKDYTKPDIHDVFHIYLSKILYESIPQITNQCIDWGFTEESIKPFAYIQIKDLKKYTYLTQAVILNHDESNTIVVAFRGTEPTDLLQWMTDASTNMVVIDDVDNNNNNDNKVQVHAGFYAALGLSTFNLSQPIDFNNVTKDSPMFIQLLDYIKHLNGNNKKCTISITGHSLGAGLASLFSYVLLAYGYESSISGVYTYGQPLVGNRRYAEILNNKLGNRIHRWVNHSDIVPRIPVIELPSIAGYYARTPYSDALGVATNTYQTKSDLNHQHYYHSGLRFKIDRHGDYARENLIDQGPILAYQDRLDITHLVYAIQNIIYSFFNITPLRSLLWLIAPVDINDHFPGDYARKIKKIVKKMK